MKQVTRAMTKLAEPNYCATLECSYRPYDVNIVNKPKTGIALNLNLALTAVKVCTHQMPCCAKDIRVRSLRSLSAILCAAEVQITGFDVSGG